MVENEVERKVDTKEKFREIARRPGKAPQKWEDLLQSESGGAEFLKIRALAKDWEKKNNRNFIDTYNRFKAHK